MSKAGGGAPKPAWDQRGNDASVWKPLLHGKKSGTFVVRSSSAGGEGVVASITVVDRGGGAFFERRIVSVGGGARPGVAIFRSEHVHPSLPALIKFYQDPKYFATAIKLDVPAPLIVPEGGAGDGLYEECFWHADRPPPSAAAAAAAGSDYGPLYDGVGGALLKRIIDEPVDESIYFTIYNPMDEVAITPLTTLSKAMEILAGKVQEISKADGHTALMYASAHAHLGKVQRRPGGAALTASDIAAIHMYTMPTDFYGKMNATLGGYDGSDTYREVDHYLPVTKLLVTALEKLPLVAGKLFRGVARNYKDILKTPEGNEANGVGMAVGMAAAASRLQFANR
eukprot:gene7866-6026_t